MTSFLCPRPRLKLLPRILLPEPALTALTPFLSLGHCDLPFDWINKPKKSVWRIPAVALPRQKFSFLIPFTDSEKRFLCCRWWFPDDRYPELFNKSFESDLLYPAEISGPLNLPLQTCISEYDSSPGKTAEFPCPTIFHNLL
ncbi:hypothetical protein GOODEAATRI_031727 [Goodea atripinnis]|uniref:Uncharacterized protein n=1 Tax=Goodea atripinnis TaxID=208336 RepID=A0ABV0MMC9_9TELE